MGFLHHTVRLTVLLGVVLIPLAAWALGARFAMGLVGGTLWSLANLLALKALVTRAFGFSHSPRWQRVCLFIVKFPLLYAVGCWLCLSPWGSPVGFLIGFSLWQGCLVVSALMNRDGLVVSRRFGN